MRQCSCDDKTHTSAAAVRALELLEFTSVALPVSALGLRNYGRHTHHSRGHAYSRRPNREAKLAAPSRGSLPTFGRAHNGARASQGEVSQISLPLPACGMAAEVAMAVLSLLSLS